MKKNIPYNENLNEVLNQIKKGAFLTVKSGDILNTMTIGWASFGIIWNKPILMVMVRKSRYTHNIIEKADNFTVSVPINVDLKKALIYCGSYSGRDVDKFKEANLTEKKSQAVISPIIKECDYHYECRILFSQPMNAGPFDATLNNRFYPTGDLHTIYFGEIVESYIMD